MICRDEIIRLSLGNSNNQFVSAIFDYLKENVKGELIPNYRSNNKGFDILWKLGSNKKVWLMIRPLISQRINDIHPRKIEKIFTTIKHYKYNLSPNKKINIFEFGMLINKTLNYKVPPQIIKKNINFKEIPEQSIDGYLFQKEYNFKYTDLKAIIKKSFLEYKKPSS